MRRRGAWRLWPWIAALVPAAAGTLAALSLDRAYAALPVVHVRIDIASLALMAGLLASGAALAGLVLRRAAARRREQAVSGARRAAADDRRRFLRRLDHELKNPLTAIQAGLALQSVEQAPPSAPPAQASIDTQVRRISRLTADLRKLAELENRPLEAGPVDLAALLTQVVELAQQRPEAVERRISLALPKAPWPLPTVSGDYDLLLLAVLNLADNALKFSRPGDTVEVRGLEDGAAVVVEVADTGPGIADEDLPHVWEELYRGDATRDVPGSGLGLALVRAIVERHGGQADLRSRAGQGTVVRLRLPIRR